MTITPSRLPLAAYHIAFAWLDLFSDVMGIWSTVKTLRDDKLMQSVFKTWDGVYLFFLVALISQITLVVGNQVTHGILAVMHASKRGGDEVRLPALLMAFVRGLCGFELLYHQWGKAASILEGEEGLHLHIQGALNYKLVELIFEAPQIIVSWTIVLVKFTVQRIYGAHVDSLKVTWNVVSAAFGLVSLTIAVLEFSRMHYRVFWACHEKPKRLFLGIFDTSTGTWPRSLVIGLHAFCSLLSRACLYMLVYALCLGLLVDKVAVLLPPFVIVVVSFTLNLLLVAPMRSWRVVLAALVSMWVNIPWIAAPTDAILAGTSRYVLLRGCWPAWIAEFVYSLLTIALAVVFPIGLDQFESNNPRQNPNGGWYGGGPPQSVIPNSAALFIGVVLPIASASCSLLLYIGYTGWILQQRRRLLNQGPLCGPLALQLSPVRSVKGLPHSLLYEWSWQAGLVAAPCLIVKLAAAAGGAGLQGAA